MSGLFWKIFLWFWLAMLVMGGTFAWTLNHLGRSELPALMARSQERFQQDAREALSVLREQGVSALRQWLQAEEHRQVMNFYLLDMNGRLLAGPELPARLRPLALSPPGMAYAAGEQEGRLLVRALGVPGVGFVRAIAEFKPPSPLWSLLSPWRWLSLLLVSALVCLLLARHLSSPVRRLSRAAQRLAAGELDVRVAEQLGRRHDELGELGRDFDRMAAHLQRLLASQQQLLRDLSHELRSPLARLQVALGLARRRTGDELAASLDRIEQEAERLDELIGRILELTRLADLDQEQMRQPLALEEILHQVVEDARFEAADQAREIKLLACEPVQIEGDPRLLHSAMENVVRNALRHTAEHSTVEVSLQQRDGWACVEVCDHGPGLPPQWLQRVFEPFVRVDAARDRQRGGHGVGLAIAKRVVEGHGGHIEARNHPEGGLQVELCLPLGRAKS